MAPTKAAQLVSPCIALKLKRTIFTIGLSQAELAREIKLPTKTQRSFAALFKMRLRAEVSPMV